MSTGTLFGLHVSDAEAAVLCVAVVLVLGSLIAGGFVLLWRSERGGRQTAREAGRGPHELGLLALWKFERAPQGGLALPSVTRAEGIDPVRPSG